MLREWPPGYGGIERVAHELGVVWRTPVYSLDAQRIQRVLDSSEKDPLPVPYLRRRLQCLQLGRLLLPLPSRRLMQLLQSREPLHGHLPSPGVLLILMLARCLQPQRWVSAHWHAFLEAGPEGGAFLFRFYQKVAMRLVPLLSEVITTSPLLAGELVQIGCSPDRVRVLPCCLDEAFERDVLALPLRRQSRSSLRVLFIGRLDSYKRLDWLITALSEVQSPWQLDVVGDGPRREEFEQQSQGLPVYFHGRLDEVSKVKYLAQAGVLVLPSDRSNEAFGIVQLEAMAAGVPSLAFDRHRSGMGWVGALPGLVWSQQPEDLAAVLARLAADDELQCVLSAQARERYQRCFSRAVWERQLRGLGS